MKIQSKLHLLLLVVLVLGGLLPPVVAAQSDEEPVVRAVLFYSPTCPHCHTVINELIVPMTQEYGDKLEVLGIDTSQPSGGQFYQAAIEHFAIPNERRGVPTLIIGQVVLVGSGEIPAQFPQLVEQHMAAGGIGWPDVPDLVEAIEASASPENETEAPPEAGDPPTTETEATAPAVEPTAEEQVAPLPAATSTPVPAVARQSAQQSVQTIGTENVPQVSAEATSPPPDPVGVALAATVLIGMLATLLWIIWRLLAGKPSLFGGPVTQLTSWAIPFISLFGLGVSIYLAYVEINHIDAVCGPVGHCNIVQSSQYAQLMGIPIAVLGILNYITLVGLWAIQKYTNGSPASLALLGLAGLTVFSTLFSVYLTVLEIFVINAVCMWCVSSAIISTILMVLVFVPLTPSRPQRPPVSAAA